MLKHVLESEYKSALLTDFCQLAVANGAVSYKTQDKTARFDLFFRKIPDGGGFVIAAGLSQLIDYLRNMKFSEEDIEYLRSTQMFSEEFTDYLRDFKFTCDVFAVPEGTPVFPKEPFLTVRGPLIQAQLVEIMALLFINHQSLIATKANRIVRAADSREVYEFGSRTAHGISAALLGARAAFIGGCSGTANALAAKEFGIPPFLAMSHSWVLSFGSELEAFKAYAATFPNNCVVLVDTYNTIKSGIPNAIKAFDEVLKPLGVRPKAIRIDSGDITYLSRKARAMLDAAGYPDCAVAVSNSLDENIIRDLLLQGAEIDIFGVGERLITAASDPVLGCVYKLSAIEESGKMEPRIKISDNVGKITLPGEKTVWRLFDREIGKAMADLITLSDEEVDQNAPYELFDPDHTWKRKTVDNFVARHLLQPVFVGGKCVYNSPTLPEIQSYCRNQISHLWDEVLRFENPHNYYVDLSQRLWDLRGEMLSSHS